jgi:hypothetical protein
LKRRRYRQLNKNNNNEKGILMASLSERLEAAALALAGCEPIKDRLAIAWGKHLADLEARDVRDEFEQLFQALNRERALPGDTVLKASLRKLSTAEASRYATLIIRTYGHVASMKTSQLQILPRAVPQMAKFLISEASR